MSLVEEFIGTFFQDVLWASIKRVGSFVRYVFLRTKFTYNEIYSQEWNGRIGLLTITTLLLLGYLLSKYWK